MLAYCCKFSKGEGIVLQQRTDSHVSQRLQSPRSKLFSFLPPIADDIGVLFPLRALRVVIAIALRK